MKHETDGRRNCFIQSILTLGAGALIASQAFAAAAPPVPATGIAAAEDGAGVTVAQWRQQKIDFPFAAFTAFYTCTGLEEKMRLILLTFGARPDLKVHAYSCDRAQDRPNKSAWVSVEFSSLVPAANPTAPGTIKAAWKDVRLEPNRPHDMGMGECELVEQMGDMVKKGFTLRNVEYHTTCVPKQVSIGDYSVTAQSLQSASSLQAAAH
jgi:hypothetical protein